MLQRYARPKNVTMSNPIRATALDAMGAGFGVSSAWQQAALARFNHLYRQSHAPEVHPRG